MPVQNKITHVFTRFEINFLENSLGFNCGSLREIEYSEMFQVVYKMIPCCK